MGKNITGLNENTSYAVSVKARNGDSTETALGTSSSVYTLAGAYLDLSGPVQPKNITATITSDSKVQLNWTDPTDSDLKNIIILRGKNGQPVTGTPLATVLKGVKTYIDSDVSTGDTLEYMLRATDTLNNAGPLTLVITANVPETSEEIGVVVTAEEIIKEVIETTVEINNKAEEVVGKTIKQIDKTVENEIVKNEVTEDKFDLPQPQLELEIQPKLQPESKPVAVILNPEVTQETEPVLEVVQKPQSVTVISNQEGIQKPEPASEIVQEFQSVEIPEFHETETGTYVIPVNLFQDKVSESSLISASTGDLSFLIEEIEILEYESLHAVPEVATEATIETSEEEKVEVCSSKISDSDSDGIFDAAEKYIYGTNCMNADSDNDGRNDGQEIFMDMTSPVEANKIEKVNLDVSTFVKDSTFTSATPLITGTAETGTKVMVYVVGSGGKNIFYGYAIADKNNHYVVSGSTVLNDGSYKMYVVDKKGNKSSKANISIAAKKNKFKNVKFTAKETSKTKSLFGKKNSKSKIPAPVKITSKGRAELSGGLSLPVEIKNMKKYIQLYAIWRSAVFTSTLLVDTSSGSFSIKSPEILEEGKHEVILYLADKNVKSEVVRIPFDVTEEDLKAALAEKGSSKSFYYGLMFVVLFIVGGMYIYKRKLSGHGDSQI